MKSILVVLLTCLLTGLNGQVTGLYSLRALNPYLDHSAFAGMDASLDIHASYRSQWNEVEGNPVSQYLSISAPVKTVRGAVGARVTNERLGALTQTQFSASYNYILPTRVGRWSIGARVSALQVSLNGDQIRTPEGSYSDFFIQHNDAVLPIDRLGSSQVGIELSSFLSMSNLQLGVSVHNINEPRLSFGENDISIAQYQRSIHGMARYRLRFLEDWITIPSIMVHYTSTSLQTAVMSQFIYRDGFSAGIGVRGYSSNSLESIMLSAGTRLGERLWARYSYDLGLNQIAQTGLGSHEILLSYRLDLQQNQLVKPKIIYNPRYID